MLHVFRDRISDLVPAPSQQGRLFRRGRPIAAKAEASFCSPTATQAAIPADLGPAIVSHKHTPRGMTGSSWGPRPLRRAIAVLACLPLVAIFGALHLSVAIQPKPLAVRRLQPVGPQRYSDDNASFSAHSWPEALAGGEMGNSPTHVASDVHADGTIRRLSSGSPVYVKTTGSDSNSGASPAAALRTFAAAITTAAGTRPIHIAGGSYSTTTLNLPSGTKLWGGWSSDFTSRNPDANPVFLTSSGTGMTCTSSSDILVEGVRLTVELGGGHTAYGMRLNSCTNVRIYNSRISVWAGADGADGAPGSDGSNGGKRRTPAEFANFSFARHLPYPHSQQTGGREPHLVKMMDVEFVSATPAAHPWEEVAALAAAALAPAARVAMAERTMETALLAALGAVPVAVLEVLLFPEDLET